MGLLINRKANPLPTTGPESTTLQSACYDYIRLAGNDTRPDVTTKVAKFADERDSLDRDAVKRLFDEIWKNAKSDKTSNVFLDLSGVRGVVPLFKAELAYLSRQLRQQRRFVRLSGVSLEGDWDSWL